MKKAVNSLFFIQLSLALMFIAIGIMGITDYNSGAAEFGRSVNKLFGQSNNIIPILFAVLELVAGVLLFMSLFTGLPSKFLSISMLVIFVFWAVTIAMNYLTSNLFEPNFIEWLAKVSPQLVILSALWMVTRNK